MSKPDWKAIIRGVAPTLGTVLAGPLAGGAIRVIADQFLGKPDATEDEVATAVNRATLDELLKFKEIEATFKLRLEELKLRPEELEVQDRASAREMFKTNYWAQISLAIGYNIAFFACFAFMFTSDLASMSEFQKNAILLLLGNLNGGVNATLAFYFGSSFGSKEKTAALAASQPANGNGNGKKPA